MAICNFVSVFSHVTRVHLHPGDKAKLTEGSFDEVELDSYSFLEDKPVEFQLRDEISRHPWSLESVNWRVPLPTWKNFKLHCCHCLCNTACSGAVDCRIRMLDAAVLFSRLLWWMNLTYYRVSVLQWKQLSFLFVLAEMLFQSVMCKWSRKIAPLLWTVRVWSLIFQLGHRLTVFAKIETFITHTVHGLMERMVLE